MSEMHVQDFAKIMRRAWTEAHREYQQTKAISGPRDGDQMRTLAGIVILLGYISNAADQYAREPCRKCGYPQANPECLFPGHIQCIQGSAVQSAAASRSVGE